MTQDQFDRDKGQDDAEGSEEMRRLWDREDDRGEVEDEMHAQEPDL